MNVQFRSYAALGLRCHFDGYKDSATTLPVGHQIFTAIMSIGLLSHSWPVFSHHNF